jgi:lipopolysaccharide export system protein LptA
VTALHRFSSSVRRAAHAGALLLVVAAAPLSLAPLAPAEAQTRARPQQTNPLGQFAGNSRDPIRIDAAKLEVRDKEQKAIYSGDVVAVRGTTTIRTPQMTIFYSARRDGPGATPAANGNAQDGSIRRIEMTGPVSVVNGAQTATANQMIYDAPRKEILLIGNAVIADGQNVQRGERIVYNTETGIATVSGGRVQGVFTPGEAAPAAPRR